MFGIIMRRGQIAMFNEFICEKEYEKWVVRQVAEGGAPTPQQVVRCLAFVRSPCSLFGDSDLRGQTAHRRR